MYQSSTACALRVTCIWIRVRYNVVNKKQVLLKASYKILDDTQSSHSYIYLLQEAWGCLDVYESCMAAVQAPAELWKMRQVCAAWTHHFRSLQLLALTISRVWTL